MNAPAERSARRFLQVLLLLYLIFVVYGSLVPLNFQPMPLNMAWARFQETPFLDLGIGSRADWVANLLLFIPLAFLAMQVLAGEASTAQRMAAAVSIFLACFVLALGIEFTQLFFPPRTISQNDIFAETLGALVGICLHVVRGPSIVTWLSGWWLVERGRATATRALHGYLIVMLAFSVMPLDLTLSPVELVHKFTEGRVNLIPFATIPTNPVEALYKLATDALLWLPVGLLWRLGGASVLRTTLRGIFVAAVIESLQLFVFSRFTNITDVVMAGIGCYLGARLVPASKVGATDTTCMAGSAPTVAQMAWVPPKLPWLPLCAVWAMLTLAAFWYPFNFEVDAETLSLRISGLMRVPFESYYRGSEFHALNELFRKVLMFMPGGLLWAAYVQQGEVWSRRPRIWLGCALAILLALTVEGGQLFLPRKVADFTDAVLSSSGALIGLVLGLRVMGLAQQARHKPDVASRSPQPTHISAPDPATVTSRAVWPFDLIAIGILALALFMAGKIGAVPYNVHELFAPGIAGMTTAIGLALACWWLFVTPLVLLEHWYRRPEKALWLSVCLPVMSAVGALLLIPTTPDESLFDILGSPVLEWPANLELIGRYMAMHGVLALSVCGAVFLLARLCWRRARYLLQHWLIAALVWAIPLHWIVVTMAATDNLTELMRDGGGPLSSIYLFGGLLAFFTAASACAAAIAVSRRRVRTLLATLLAWPLAASLLWLGSEHVLFKYGKLFSAAQFLLSANREHYAQGMALGVRFMVASMAVFLLVALLQAARWRRVATLLQG
ncbi:MAG TPA: VanZ family protein [Rhodocyclaceae bacterium]|nr:VanZ family protein [Rhodocyclaceae bacterium]